MTLCKKGRSRPKAAVRTAWDLWVESLFPNQYELMPMVQPTTVANIIGPWKGEAPTTLLQHCRDAWDTPFKELSDIMVATFLNQRIALPQMLAEAKRRLDSEPREDTEYFDDQLAEAVLGADK
ncbi:hypothetical protein [Pseudomonas quasicaspiana]|nr:hypothetical protein [Pseudomonas quasicaspiana]MCD5969904.1 hypothetical protein [Pseudomonas quasicaspiana]